MGAALDTAANRLTAAQQSLASIESRMAAGDTTVTGTELADARAELTVAEQLFRGAQDADIATQAGILATSVQTAKSNLMSSYATSVGSVTSAVANARSALGTLVTACASHQALIRQGKDSLRALGASPASILQGVRLDGAPPAAVVCAVAYDTLGALTGEDRAPVITDSLRALGAFVERPGGAAGPFS